MNVNTLKPFCFNKPRLIMFDLDGTLVDSVPDLAFAVDAMLVALGKAPAGQDKVRHWVGNGAAMLVKRALSQNMIPVEIDALYFQQASDLFFKFYEQVNGSKSQLYTGVLGTLNRLRQDIPFMALVTNKPEQFTQPLLDFHRLPKFDLVVCGDTLPKRKPAPDQLVHCMKVLGCKPEESLMVGDSLSDIKAAKAANVPIVCVQYGYNQGEDLSSYRPDKMLDRFDQVLALFDLAGG